MQKFLIDTNLYIDFLRSGKYHSRIETIYIQKTSGIFLSAVVAQELLTGAVSRQGIRNVQSLIAPFERRDRVVTPIYSDWKTAGETLSRLFRGYPSARSKLPTLVSDTLIALSARRIGATLYTNNRRDFEWVQKYIPFSFEVISDELSL
ncbi:MAG: PIN domain-containing protein [Nitrospirae bacterium]|nr:PIN domain-containing protein [Nitrospirota bacterium]